MKNQMLTDVNKDPKIMAFNQTTYEAYIVWMATPSFVKVESGIETSKAFAEFYKITQVTLWRWADRKDFKDRVRVLRSKWAFEKTQGVLEGTYQSAVRGNPHSQKLWLQFFEDFKEKQGLEVTETKKVVLGVNDLRYAIEQLPEPLRTKHYGHLRELLEDIVSIRNSRDIEDERWNERPAETVSNETDNNAQDVRYIEPANVVAESDKTSVRTDMVRTVPKSNNQSAERWGEK